ncbi:LysR substrate-binding domain-containing protein [Sphingomonas sp.]|uniref:LysR substrate-binding domain-containing protein n=1 Tax=Sphingomonas sp. TaxID=28214 RepID=UPI003D6D5656
MATKAISFGTGVSVNFQHLRAFHAIAVEASVSRAARRLNVSQPTLSQQLKALEERHGVTLFESRKSPLKLSETGKQLFRLSQKLFSASDDISEMLSGAVGLDGTTLRIASDSPPYAAQLVAAFHRLHPTVQLRVRIGNAREVIEQLRQAEADVAIASDPPGDTLFAYEPLYADRIVIALPAGHALAGSTVFPLAALQSETLLIREETSRTRAISQSLVAAAEIEPVATIEMHTREAIREAVALGVGVGFFFSCEAPPDPRIVYLPVEGSEVGFRLSGYVVCLTDRRRTALVREVMAIVETLRSLSPVALPGVDKGGER